MTRVVPGIERAVAVLDFLAAHPGEGFTLSELARRLHLNKATCHSTLGTLTSAGYLLRHPVRKTYTLGPGLIALGSAAQGQYQAVEFAREEMRAVSEDLGLECLASTTAPAPGGDEIVILARSAGPWGRMPVQLGQRLPLVPPLGTVFLAWAEPGEIDRWLTRVGTVAGERGPERHREVLAAVRARGYAVGLEADARARLGRALAELADDPRAERVRAMVEELVEELGHEEYALGELQHDTTYRVNTISAPVFGPAARVELALTVVGFRDQLTARQVPAYAERLLEATRRVTKSIHGKEPES